MIKELRRFETTFEDGTYWVEYETSNGKISYEMIFDIDEEVELSEDKINLEDLPIEVYVSNLLHSEDECVSLEYDEEDKEEFEELLGLIEETLEKYPELEDYIEIYDDEEIFIYGGLITKVLF